MTMITPSYLGETIEYSSLHACRSTLEDPTADGKQSQGIVVVSAGPKELTVAQIIGPIDPAMLSELGGKMGIPKIEPDPKQKTKKDD